MIGADICQCSIEKRLAELISEYGALRIDQIEKYLGMEREGMHRVIKSLVKKGRIIYEKDSELIKAHNSILPDEKMISCFWVVLDFKDDWDFHYAGKYPLMIMMYTGDNVYEIYYCPLGDERAVTHAVNHFRESISAKTLIVVEEELQMQKIEVSEAVFCTITEEGEVTYYE